MRFGRPLRVVKIVYQSRRVRRIMAAIVATFRNIGDILLMVIVYVFIFAIMATHIFSDINVQETVLTPDELIAANITIDANTTYTRYAS